MSCSGFTERFWIDHYLHVSWGEELYSKARCTSHPLQAQVPSHALWTGSCRVLKLGRSSAERIKHSSCRWTKEPKRSQPASCESGTRSSGSSGRLFEPRCVIDGLLCHSMSSSFIDRPPKTSAR